MRYTDLLGHKWWDESPTIRLFHGTSSQFIPAIREHGLLPPQSDLSAYALDVLNHYIPREQQTPELQRKVLERAARVDAGRAGERGAVIYCFTHSEDVEGYAQSYAQHGGEIAYDVYMIACQEKADPEMSWVEFRRNLPFSPRFSDAKPIVVEVLVPKEWCRFDVDLDRFRRQIDMRYVEETPMSPIYDKALRRREIRIVKAVPVEMIQSIRTIDQ